MTPTPNPTAEHIAQRFHEAYERLAPSFGYKTRGASAVSWEEVPEGNRALMIATVSEILPDLLSEGAPSEEQIVAALNASVQEERRQMRMQPIPDSDLSRDISDWGPQTVARMRAALTAAGVVPQGSGNDLSTSPEHVKNEGDSLHVALPTDREKLAEQEAEEYAPGDHEAQDDFLTGWRTADQNPATLDPVKVAEVLNRHEPIFKDGQYAGRCVCGFEHPSYSGWRLHRSGAICEAHKEGKLT